MKISENTVVTLNYTLKNSDGELLDTSVGRKPLVYLHGVGGLIPGLEKELKGREKGENLHAVIKPEEAYGRRNDNMIKVVSKDGFQGEGEIQVGMRVRLDTDQGAQIGNISKIEGNDVTLDLNHPLADVTLHFDVDILDVRSATDEEISHGHAHGPGGHHH